MKDKRVIRWRRRDDDRFEEALNNLLEIVYKEATLSSSTLTRTMLTAALADFAVKTGKIRE